MKDKYNNLEHIPKENSMATDNHSPTYNLFALALLAVAAFVGFQNLGWYFILILGAFNMISYTFFESTVTANIIKQHGIFFFIVVYIPQQILMGSVPSAIVYFIAYFIASLI